MADIVLPGKYFFDCPTYTRDEALEYPVVDEWDYYLSENSEGGLLEDPRFVIQCRTPILAPFLGYAPVFDDAWSQAQGDYTCMFLWNSTVLGSGTDDRIMVINVAIKSTATDSRFLTGAGDGSFTLQIPKECAGEILGIKAAPYIDKMGHSIHSPATDTGINKPYLHLGGGPATPGEADHTVIKNPLNTLGDPPTTDQFDGENGGTLVIVDSPVAWLSPPGSDALKWLGPQAVRFGFGAVPDGRGLRLYVKGYDAATIMELAVGDVDGSQRLKAVYFGPTRVYYFGLPGDKVRWYLDRRCGEPNVYAPLYGGEDPVLPATPDPTPLACLGGGTVAGGGGSGGGGGGGGGGGTDLPPTVLILSGPD